MIIKVNKYVIMSKERPLEFHCGSGCMTESFEDTDLLLYGDVDDARSDLETFDEPDKFEILKVEVICEI